MKSYEMVETLSNKAHVSLEQAKEALENSNWDILDAAIYIERRRVSMDAPRTQPSPPNSAYFVSGQQNEVHGGYATPGFGRPGPFDPRVDFNKPYGGDVPPYKDFPNRGGYVPPYKDFPNQGGNVPPYKDFPRQQPYERQSVGEFVGKLEGLLENIVNHIFGASFVVSRHGKTVLNMHIMIFLIIAFVFWWAAIPALVLGVAFDYKYSLGVKDKNGKPVSDFISNTMNTAEMAKENFMKEAENVKTTFEQSKREFTEDFKKGRESVSVDLTKKKDKPEA